MEKSVEIVGGDTPGTEWRFAVLRFRGADPDAPSAYLQAGLHSNELPGVAALHFLAPQLAAAEADGRLAGDVTLVPQANPIGAGQYLFAEPMGRFALNGRGNFNRGFPLPNGDGTAATGRDDAPLAADARLKGRLVALIDGADIVLDLHCDDESPAYLYVPAPFWPHMADLAACLAVEAVLLWDDTSDGAFEEAAYARSFGLPPERPEWRRRAVSTVELRGRADVSEELARRDAAGLYRFLAGRGVVRNEAIPAPPSWNGPATPLDRVEVVRAPVGGAMLFHAKPGDRVEAGAPLVTLLTAPGEAGGETLVRAPQAGTVLTRRTQRAARRGDALRKLGGRNRAVAARPRALAACRAPSRRRSPRSKRARPHRRRVHRSRRCARSWFSTDRTSTCSGGASPASTAPNR